nr:MAG TPA: hypothetical protein [Caudoviricetes sp.]
MCSTLFLGYGFLRYSTYLGYFNPRTSFLDERLKSKAPLVCYMALLYNIIKVDL